MSNKYSGILIVVPKYSSPGDIYRELVEDYEQQPANALLRAKGTAENALMAFSEEVCNSALEEELEHTRNSIIVDEIRQLRSFWPQFGVNLAGGFASALLFASLLAIMAFLVISDHSAVQIGSELRGRVEEASP